MQVGRILLIRLLGALLSIMVMDLGVAEAAQKAKQSRMKFESSPIVGELDEGDTIPTDEDDKEMPVDEEDEALFQSKENSKLKNKNSKKILKTEKEKIKDKKAEQKQKKIKEGFSKAEEFHKMWFNLPMAKIKSSLENLSKFCKVACTKKHCMDEEIANNCHLVCPELTTRQCPDPLKQTGEEDMDAEEIGHGDDASFESTLSADNANSSVSSSAISSLEQDDSAFKEGDGEGG